MSNNLQTEHKLDIGLIREDFPILRRIINGKPLIYFDNAATTQKPRQVTDALLNFYENSNANIHRSTHTLAAEATESYEKTREKCAKFINAASPKEIVFTKNATEALNLVAYSLGSEMQEGDEIVTTIMEHHSNMVPWQMLERHGVKVRYVNIYDDGTLNMDDLEKMVTHRTKIVAVSHASNVTGVINPIKRIAQIAHKAGALMVVDGAQSAPHMPVNVRDLDADFFAFSAHKMLGPTGVGVLYGRRKILENMQPFLRGGEMIKEVTLEGTTFNDVPHKFEAGTPNIADVIAFGAAIDYLNDIGMQNIRKHEIELTSHALKSMDSMGGIKIYGTYHTDIKGGIVSFNIHGAHPHDIASLLDDQGIAVRSGNACAMPLVNRLGAQSICRASFYIYNTLEEVDAFIDALAKVKRVFKIA